MKFSALLPIAFIVLTSGCLESLGFEGGLFGTGSQEIVAPNDILLIKDTQVVPSGQVPAESVFDVSFQVQNTGGAETGKEATKVEVLAFDWGNCVPQDTSLLSNGVLKGISNQPVTIFPGGGTRLIEWEFKAPTNDQLGGVRGTCPIRFKVSYDFDALTVASFTVINEERLKELNRAGVTSTDSGQTAKSEGPIKIDIKIDSPQPIRTGTTVPLRIFISDEGLGLYREVPTGALELIFPSELTSVSCDERMTTSGSSRKNVEAIQLIQKVSPPVRCDITVPGEDKVLDLRTLSIQARLHYTYVLYDEVDVSIKPTFERVSSTSDSTPSGFESGSSSGSSPSGFESSGGPV